jgi:hypothetical protein
LSSGEKGEDTDQIVGIWTRKYSVMAVWGWFRCIGTTGETANWAALRPTREIEPNMEWRETGEESDLAFLIVFAFSFGAQLPPANLTASVVESWNRTI